MEGTSTRNVLLVVSVGALVAATLLVLPRLVENPERVRDAAAVRHSDVAGAPENADVKTMVASYYASVLEGEPTASGETYQPERYTAAHKTLPLGTEVRVSYGGEAVEVVVNDRGPFVEGRDIDLSLAAAREIGLTAPGTAPVRVTVL